MSYGTWWTIPTEIRDKLFCLTAVESEKLPSHQAIKSFNIRPWGSTGPMKREQFSVIGEFNEILSFVVTATSVGMQDKQKKG